MEEGVMKWITREEGGTHTVEAYFVGAEQETMPGRSDKTETSSNLGKLTVAHLEVEAHR
jgi:hypothetical protein